MAQDRSAVATLAREQDAASEPDTEQAAQAAIEAPAGARDGAGAEAGVAQVDAEAEAQQQDEQPDDWRAKYEDTEAKRRDLQSARDRATAERDEARGQIQALDSAWRAYIARNAPELAAKMAEAERSTAGDRSSAKSSEAASLAVINGVYREGNREFAQYLEAIVEDGARLTPQSLDRHRATFDRIRGNGATTSNNGNGGTEPPKSAPKSAAPPRIAGAGSPPAAPPPVWKPGDPMNPKGLIAAGLKSRVGRK